MARRKGGRRVSLRKRVAKKRTVVRRVQRKPRKMVYRKRAQPRRKAVQKKRKVRIAKPKVNKCKGIDQSVDQYDLQWRILE